MVAVILMGKLRNIRERCGVEDVVTKTEKGMLRRFEHVENMSERGMTETH